MKLSAIINAQPSLQKLTSLELPIASAIKVLQICKDTAVHVEAFQATQKSLFEKYGTENPKNEGELIIEEENTEVFTKEMNEVLDTEVDYKVEPLDVSDFGDAKLTVSDLARIEWLLK